MNYEVLLLIKKHTDTLIEKTKTKAHEALEFKVNKQMQTISFNPPIILVEEGKCLLAVSSFECTNSVFNKTDENNSFAIIIPGHHQTNCVKKTIDELKKILELRSIELHVKEIRKRGNKTKVIDNEYKLSHVDTQKNEILEELKKAKNNDLEDLVYRKQLTYYELIDVSDLKYIPTLKTGYSINPSIYKVVDIDNILKCILPDNVKTSVRKDDVRLLQI